MSAFTHPFLEEPAEREHYGDEKKKSPPAPRLEGNVIIKERASQPLM